VRETSPSYGDTPPGGHRRRRPEDYDRTLCLLPSDVVDFVLATQPRQWKKLTQHHGAAVREQFLDEMFVSMDGKRMYLWRAITPERRDPRRPRPGQARQASRAKAHAKADKEERIGAEDGRHGQASFLRCCLQGSWVDGPASLGSLEE